MKRSRKTTSGAKRFHGFVAYPTDDRAQMSVIEKAIPEVNKSLDCRLTLHGWKDVNRASPSRIMQNILDSIDRYDYLAADVSGLNPNVLFEVGYAFARGKRLLLLGQGNSDADRRRDFDDCHLLAGLEVTPFRNVADVVACIAKRVPGSSLPQADIDTYLPYVSSKPLDGLFLQGSVKHEIALSGLDAFQAYYPHCIQDDWDEDASQSLNWYLSAIGNAQAVVALFVGPSWNNARQMNARYSLLCGLAVGWERKVLMIGLTGFRLPFDYRDWFKAAETLDQIRRYIDSKLAEKNADGNPRLRIVGRGITSARQEPRTEEKDLVLLDIAMEVLSQNIAENEELALDEYFVETSSFNEALSGKAQIFVGSKGTGKTANFFQLKTEILKDKRNVVCDVKPTDYRLGRLLAGLSRVRDRYGAAKHIAETAWKIVIYCELLQAIRRRIVDRPTSLTTSKIENELLSFCVQHKSVVDAPLEARLDLAAEWLEQSQFAEENFTKRAHDTFLIPASRVLEPVLAKMKGRCMVVMDNLDKAWELGQDLVLQSTAVDGLLSSCPAIEDDLHRKANINLVVFLRRNIFEYILELSREPDKLIEQVAELLWNDQEMLMAIVNRRVLAACIRHKATPMDPWRYLFPVAVRGEPTPSWIFGHVFHRPRDLIRLVRRAMENAVNHRRSEVAIEDLDQALTNYSSWAYGQAIAEYQAECPWLYGVLSSFTGANAEWSLAGLERHLRSVLREMNQYVSPRDVASCLVRIGFFGVVVGSECRYSVDLGSGRTLYEMVRYHPRLKPLTLRLHPVFHAHLTVVDGRTATGPMQRFIDVIGSLLDF